MTAILKDGTERSVEQWSRGALLKCSRDLTIKRTTLMT
jgi:hypothetical protein